MSKTVDFDKAEAASKANPNDPRSLLWEAMKRTGVGPSVLYRVISQRMELNRKTPLTWIYHEYEPHERYEDIIKAVTVTLGLAHQQGLLSAETNRKGGIKWLIGERGLDVAERAFMDIKQHDGRVDGRTDQVGSDSDHREARPGEGSGSGEHVHQSERDRRDEDSGLDAGDPDEQPVGGIPGESAPVLQGLSDELHHQAETGEGEVPLPADERSAEYVGDDQHQAEGDAGDRPNGDEAGDADLVQRSGPDAPDQLPADDD